MATGKRNVIIGLGQTGYSCARYFRAHGIPFEFMDHNAAVDLANRVREEMPDVRLTLGRMDAAVLLAAERIVVSPGVPLATAEIRQARAAGIPVTGDIDLFRAATDRPVIGITGSNGKSTVTSLVGEIARECGIEAGVGGNLGPPALDLLGPARSVYVLELSSFQLEATTRLAAEVAVLLNLSPDHLDRYADAAQYYAAKERVFTGCAHAVVGRADLAAVRLPPGTSLWTFGEDLPRGEREFGLEEAAAGLVLRRGTEALLRADEMTMRGRHNALNALAALAVAAAAGWPTAPAVAAVKRFPGLPHRCEWIDSIDGVEYVNDSKGTNVGATLSALAGLGEGLAGRVVLIAGGASKGADFASLREPVGRYARAVVLIGEEAARIEEALSGVCELRRAADLEAAVRLARALSQPGDLVLLSPACSSLDMFRNYAERGERFRRAVSALAAD